MVHRTFLGLRGDVESWRYNLNTFTQNGLKDGEEDAFCST